MVQLCTDVKFPYPSSRLNLYDETVWRINEAAFFSLQTFDSILMHWLQAWSWEKGDFKSWHHFWLRAASHTQKCWSPQMAHWDISIPKSKAPRIIIPKNHNVGHGVQQAFLSNLEQVSLHMLSRKSCLHSSSALENVTDKVRTTL